MSRAPSASLVRPAQPADAERIGEIHAAGMLRQVGAGLGRVVPPDVAALFDAEQFAGGWRVSIEEPPSAKHRVLVALDGERVVGFLGFGPVEAEADGGAAPASGDGGAAPASGDGGAALPAVDAEILALEVDPAYPADVHSARLLNACADILAMSGAESMRTWAVRGDELRQRFLTESGFAVLGLRRAYRVAGGEVVEDAWWAEIGDPAEER
ncbi:MAG TPA: GNAT family N-acetyltransferase [Actinomycetales bacterium]|nr:GNAT family N-acetyltransferase [Actinomycetales bacterium]